MRYSNYIITKIIHQASEIKKTPGDYALTLSAETQQLEEEKQTPQATKIEYLSKKAIRKSIIQSKHMIPK